MKLNFFRLYVKQSHYKEEKMKNFTLEFADHQMNKYFLNDITAKIFFLVELQGKQQMDLLGIDYEYYSNKKLAKNWYENLKTEIENRLK